MANRPIGRATWNIGAGFRLYQNIGPRGLFSALQILDRKAVAFHSERLHEPFAGEVLPRLAGDPLSDRTGHHIAGILVLKAATDVPARLQVAQRGQQLRARPIARHPHPVMARQAAVVTQQVQHGHPVAGNGIVEPKFGKVLAHRLGPVQPALVHQHAEARGGEGFRNGAKGEERVGGNRQARLDIALSRRP